MIWPRIIGIAVALAAEFGLYAGLHQISNVNMPAWAHRPVAHGPLAWPTLVPVAVVKGGNVAAPVVPSLTLPAPVLSPPPVVVLEPPELRLQSPANR